MDIEDITPPEFACGIGACPAVFLTDRGSILVVGRSIRQEELRPALRERVGPNEALVEVPKALLRNLTSRRLDD